VLVGHSFGATYMELFARAHPEEVSALVLVDTRHRDFTLACQDAGLTGCGIPDSVVASLRPVEIAEYEAFSRTATQIAEAGPFGADPVRVFPATSHGGFSPEVEALWVSMQASLADEASDGEQRVFEGAGHNLETDHAQDVVDAILRVMPATRAE